MRQIFVILNMCLFSIIINIASACDINFSDNDIHIFAEHIETTFLQVFIYFNPKLNQNCLEQYKYSQIQLEYENAINIKNNTNKEKLINFTSITSAKLNENLTQVASEVNIDNYFLKDFFSYSNNYFNAKNCSMTIVNTKSKKRIFSFNLMSLEYKIVNLTEAYVEYDNDNLHKFNKAYRSNQMIAYPQLFDDKLKLITVNLLLVITI